jgi:hypothetical protein
MKEWAKKNVNLSVLVTLSILLFGWISQLATQEDLQKISKIQLFKSIETDIRLSKIQLAIYNLKENLNDDEQIDYDLILENLITQEQKRKDVINGAINFNNIH